MMVAYCTYQLVVNLKVFVLSGVVYVKVTSSE